jgi:hypothetical protein
MEHHSGVISFPEYEAEVVDHVLRWINLDNVLNEGKSWDDPNRIVSNLSYNSSQKLFDNEIKGVSICTSSSSCNGKSKV